MTIITMLKNAANKVSSFFSGIWSSVTAFATKVYKKVSGQQAREDRKVAAGQALSEALAIMKFKTRVANKHSEKILKARLSTIAKIDLAKAAREVEAAAKEARTSEARIDLSKAATEVEITARQLQIEPIVTELKSCPKFAEIKKAEFYRTPEGILFHRQKMSRALNILSGIGFIALTTSGFFARQNLKP